MKRRMKIILGICFGILLCANTVSAATPRVMVSDYLVKEKKVIAGKEFNLTVTLKNTAKKVVKNIKLSVNTENGELLPAKGAGTAYIEQMEAESEKELIFNMRAANALEEKAYKLLLKTEYESSSGLEYTVEEALFIPVFVEQRLSVTDIFMADDHVELGDTVEISAMVNNLGDGMLYNVAARLKGDNIQETETYIGNIESGKRDMIDVLTKADIVTEGDHKKNQIVIFYEDKEGNVYEREEEIVIKVGEPVYENLEKVKEDNSSKENLINILEGITVITVIVIIGFLIIKRRKHKQQILDEFMR